MWIYVWSLQWVCVCLLQCHVQCNGFIHAYVFSIRSLCLRVSSSHIEHSNDGCLLCICILNPLCLCFPSAHVLSRPHLRFEVNVKFLELSSLRCLCSYRFLELSSLRCLCSHSFSRRIIGRYQSICACNIFSLATSPPIFPAIKKIIL